MISKPVCNCLYIQKQNKRVELMLASNEKEKQYFGHSCNTSCYPSRLIKSPFIYTCTVLVHVLYVLLILYFPSKNMPLSNNE